ncbi:MAG: hypothetical protein ACR2PG_12760, partial [Hyphomicrobiaceae bacterium]
MEQIIRQILDLLEQGIVAILKLLHIAWIWSFGRIAEILPSWQDLPVWKIAVLAVVMIVIAYVLYKVAIKIWSAVIGIIRAFISLLGAFVAILPYVVVAGAIAFAGS